jgi:hypothetical protein
VRWKAGCASVVAAISWVMWLNVQEAGKPPVWKTKGPFQNTAQCRNAVDMALEQIKQKEGSKIEITKRYEFGASLTFKQNNKSKTQQSYYCVPQGFEFLP